MRADVAAVFQRVAVAHLVERTDRAVVRAGEYLKSKDVSEEPQREPVEGSSSKIVIDDDKTSSAAAAAAVPTPAVKTLVVAGGVAANGLVRAELTKLAEQRGLNILIPPPKYCVDNGVMVAWTGVERLLAGLWEAPPKHLENAKFFFETRPRWPLGERDGKSNNFKERISKEMKQKMLKKGEKVKGGLNINAETTPSSEIDVLNIKGKNTSSTNATMAQTGTSEPLEAETLDQNASSKRPRGAPDGEEELLSKRAQKRLKKAEYIAERKEEERKKKEASASGGGC
ncbi:unnamed protein product [Amoebophrya sp. A25]|nr:unnamed protein product [Amoebophrya sp. A25]|eukprot:GSA25T00002845001.1